MGSASFTQHGRNLFGVRRLRYSRNVITSKERTVCRKLIACQWRSCSFNKPRKCHLLLQEIHPNSPEEETNRSLLVNFVLLASRDKALIDKAMNDLTLLASRDVLRYTVHPSLTFYCNINRRKSNLILNRFIKCRVGASLGLAMGYTMQKQPQRARNVLKIIAKTAWQFEEAEYLERCWLLLADHYVQSGKHELAYELVKKILTFNQGCSKAHELLGVIAEKDQKYGKIYT